MARARLACMWAMATQVPVTASIRRLYGPCIQRPPGCRTRPKSIGSGAAPVWGHPRWREEVHKPRASLEAGP